MDICPRCGFTPGYYCPECGQRLSYELVGPNDHREYWCINKNCSQQLR